MSEYCIGSGGGEVIGEVATGAGQGDMRGGLGGATEARVLTAREINMRWQGVMGHVSCAAGEEGEVCSHKVLPQLKRREWVT